MEEAGSAEEAGSGHEDSSHNILTLDALQVLSRSQVTLELSMSRIRPICKSLHTYIHGRTWDNFGNLPGATFIVAVCQKQLAMMAGEPTCTHYCLRHSTRSHPPV
jgi:hypothetical protein